LEATLFSFVRNTLEKSKAAVVVQNLLEHQYNLGVFRHDPAKVANMLVGRVWDEKPDVFNGAFGQRPHKISVAAAALASGAAALRNDDESKLAFVMALGNIINELSVNCDLCPLNGIDTKMLEFSIKAYFERAEELGIGDLDEELRSLLT
jgi:hypothetical protein